MNRAKLKAYAPQARRDFIQAVTDRAAFYGITKNKIEQVTQQGDVGIINGRPFPKSVIQKREKLIERITRISQPTANGSQLSGFDQVMEAVAYTWFNRFVAIRYMELHGYLDHGYRVLSHPEGKDLPEILEHATEIDFSGLNKDKVLELKLDGTRDNELYRMILVAQCNALNKAMPFLFGRVDDESELLLPENLLHTESLIRKLVTEIDEEDWQEVEIIGWLYQFYISEKKDQVIGKVVKSEDIPAATQLFTPNWIVKYMVQNTLGRKWLATYPDSSIRTRIEFYIEPVQQEPEVIEQLKKITPESLNPEEITFLDPACGSGHILVEAYELFKAIYQERGYRLRDIPELILSKNLFALEIDDRAAQLASLSLLLKARADDRHIFDRDVQPQVIAIHQTNGMDAGEIFSWLTGKSSEQWAVSSEPGSLPFSGSKLTAQSSQFTALKELIDTFQNAKTFGSLITIPQTLKDQLPKLTDFLDQRRDKDMWVQIGISMVEGMIAQAKMLSTKFDVVAANPPFMGGKYLNPVLKERLKSNYKGYEKDLFASFVIRNLQFAKESSLVGSVTPFVWMFISSYENLRDCILNNHTIATLVKPSYTAFFESAIVPLVTFTIQKEIRNGTGSFFDLGYLGSAESQPTKFLEGIINPECKYRHSVKMDDFKKIPGSPIAYWVSERVRDIFTTFPALKEYGDPRQGLATGDNDKFLRLWFEMKHDNIGFRLRSREEARSSGKKWFPCNKGGAFRKWYGNQEYVVNWGNDGHEIQNFYDDKGKLRSRPQNKEFYFREGCTWSTVSSSSFSMRYSSLGAISETKGAMCFPKDTKMLFYILGFSNSNIVNKLLSILSPTLDYHEGPFGRLPLLSCPNSRIREIAEKSAKVSQQDWDSFETSWDFTEFPLLRSSEQCAVSSEPENQSGIIPASPSVIPANAGISKSKSQKGDPHLRGDDKLATCHLPLTTHASYEKYRQIGREMTVRMKELEEENNRIFIEAYGLQDELTPEVPIEQITLTVNPKYRYGSDILEEELEIRFRLDTMKELISYSLGCMMGRYSLDKPGLIYAHSGNKGFDPSNYTTFHADADGIIPITEIDWFEDDAANRFIKFISVAWVKEHLEENLGFIADSLDRKKNEQPRDTIRRYFQNSFFKDHLKTYKKRPIYWLFTSGKQKAFQCLVYLHRYNEGTLSRMRTEYVIPLQGKIASRIEQLDRDMSKVESTSHQNKLRKEKETLLKHQDELMKFDEKLRHYADLRISLDLDDGVKVNYGKFGDLLAEVKAVMGDKPE